MRPHRGESSARGKSERMFASPPAPERESSVLIQVIRRERAEANNAWYIIRDASTGPEISEIFHHLPEDESIHPSRGTSCAFVGSNLYYIGDKSSTPDEPIHMSWIDTENPHNGWKSKQLPFRCTNAVTAVYGNFIYLFPSDGFPFTTIEQNETRYPWAYMYDTAKKKAVELKCPNNRIDVCRCPPFCVPLKGHGILVPLGVPHGPRVRVEEITFYIHEPELQEWQPFSYSQSLVSNFKDKPIASLNGILYVFKIVAGSGVLHAYQINPWKFLGPIWLEMLENLNFSDKVFVIPVEDSELVLMWHRPVESSLHYTKISICLKLLEATVIKTAKFGLDAIDLTHCLPCAYSKEGEEERQVHERNKREFGRKRKRSHFDYTQPPHRRSKSKRPFSRVDPNHR